MNTRITSPTEDRLELHYKKLGLANGWNRDRVLRLCKLIRMTPEELRALCNCSRQMWYDCMRYGKFNGPLTLHFALIECAYVAATTGHVGEPIMPFDKITT